MTDQVAFGRWKSATVGRSLLGAMILLTLQCIEAQQFEDPPTVLEADQTLTEQENDHVEAVALFAHGRVLLQRGLVLDGAERQEQFAAALRRFQRAWWFEHDLVSILEDIAPLTFELDRQFEATRYLIIAAEQQEVPLEILERVAAELADLSTFDQDANTRALKLYLKLKERQGDAVSAITLFQIGRLSLTTGKFEEAAEAFAAVQDALEQKDNQRVPPSVRNRLLRRPETTFALFGESYLRAKQLDKAEAAFRAADRAKPEPSTLAFRLALIENERGNRDAASELLQQYFDAKTQSAGLAPYVLLAELIDGPAPEKVERADDDPGRDNAAVSTPRKPSDALVDKLEQLAQFDPNNALLGYYLADALRRAEKWENAEALYKRLLKQEPAADGHQGLVNIYSQRKQFAKLLEQLAAVVAKTGSLDPLDDVTETIAQDGAMLDQLVQQAKAMVDDTGQSPPDGAWLALALLHAEAKRNEAAMGFFDQGLQQPVAGQAAVNLAFIMFQSNKPRRAAKLFQRVLDEKLLPDRLAEVYFYLAGAWTLAKDYKQGLEAACEAARREPQSPRMVAREAWVLFQAKRLPEARAKYLELLEKFDSDHTTLENREAMRDVRLALSAIDVELEDNEAAEEWLQQTLDEFPEDIGAFNDLGYLWTDQDKHLSRSLRMVQKAVDAEPDNIAYLDSLGWALYRLGRFDEAVQPLEKAAADGDVDGVILDHLGDVYLKTKNHAKAVEAWRKAIDALKKQDGTKRLKAIEEKIRRHAPQ